MPQSYNLRDFFTTRKTLEVSDAFAQFVEDHTFAESVAVPAGQSYGWFDFMAMREVNNVEFRQNSPIDPAFADADTGLAHLAFMIEWAEENEEGTLLLTNGRNNILVVRVGQETWYLYVKRNSDQKWYCDAEIDEGMMLLPSNSRAISARPFPD